MSDLEGRIQHWAAEMKNIYTELQSTQGGKLPESCYEIWRKRAELYKVLEGAHEMTSVRINAWEDVLGVSRSAPTPPTDASSEGVDLEAAHTGDQVIYNGSQVPFKVARHLSLSSYMVVNWSIYDCMATVIGRIACIPELADNAGKSPKLCESFLENKQYFGFNVHRILKDGYAWPIKCSYKVRNWLTHEGITEKGLVMFKGNAFSDGFILHDDAVTRIQEKSGYEEIDGEIQRTCLSATDEPWSGHDLLEILPKYHREIDTMYIGLLDWSINSFTDQIRAFDPRGH